MTKDDLKYGYTVELRNRDKYLVVRNLQHNEMKLKNLDDGIYEIAINEFDNGLRYGTYIDLCYNNRFDIMKVYKDFTCKELLWERKEKPKLTDDEKVILRNLDKCFKYIARDKDSRLYVYRTKPIKMCDKFWEDDLEDFVSNCEEHSGETKLVYECTDFEGDSHRIMKLVEKEIQ